MNGTGNADLHITGAVDHKTDRIHSLSKSQETAALSSEVVGLHSEVVVKNIQTVELAPKAAGLQNAAEAAAAADLNKIFR